MDSEDMISEDNVACPYCQSGDVKSDISGFVEIGEFNGKSYDDEYHIQRYMCNDCRRRFWLE